MYIKGAFLWSGRVTQEKSGFSKICIFLLPSFMGHQDLSCGTFNNYIFYRLAINLNLVIYMFIWEKRCDALAQGSPFNDHCIICTLLIRLLSKRFCHWPLDSFLILFERFGVKRFLVAFAIMWVIVVIYLWTSYHIAIGLIPTYWQPRYLYFIYHLDKIGRLFSLWSLVLGISEIFFYLTAAVHCCNKIHVYSASVGKKLIWN